MRNISSNIFADEFFGSLNKVHRLLWLGLLLNLADDQGRFMDNVALMRSLLFPYDTDVTVKDIEKGLAIFESKHKILRYVIGTNGSGKRLIQIVNWWKYQRSTQWAGRSQHPAPPKWMDRIRAHETGVGIALVNWDKAGGYEEATKKLRSGSEASTKKLPFTKDNNEVNNEVKDIVVVVVADAFNLYEEHIGETTNHVKKELERLFKINPAYLSKAILITADQTKSKHTLVYLKGVFTNLQKGTKKPEQQTRGAKTYQPKPIDHSKQVRL